MTDEQRGVFNYLYNTDGAEAAHEYLSTINKDLERKATDATVLSQRKMAQDGVTGAILANAATVGENLMNAPGYIVDAAAKAVGGSVGDTYDLANLAGKMSSDTRKTTGEAIAKQDFGKIRIQVREISAHGFMIPVCPWQTLSLLWL